MSIEISNKQGVWHTRIEGELTIYTTGEYREALLEKCDTKLGMELDLVDVTEIDTSGLQLILALKRQLEERGEALSFNTVSKAVLDIFEMLNLTETFGVEVERAVG
jgi:anti-sigma B factor antagonist